MEALPLKPFQEMTAADYAAIGLRCGLEVHQQLATGSKLFCRCPAGRYSDDYDAEVLRHMRPTLSEMGEYDGTALMEKKTRKNIIYRLHQATVCTYEFDDTPPFPMDERAIDIALEIALLLRLNLVDELHVARKQYLDGSIPTGFQRTTILGVDGRVPFAGREIRIRQLGLEEDSCREVSDRGHDRVYLTDRLGTPLIEVVTEPDLFTPQETAEACALIGRLCRSTHKVRRGYGATRQDVNVSVEGGTRIEIKGVPQTWRIPRLVYNEACRQVACLRIRSALAARGVTRETIRTADADVTALFAETAYAPIRLALRAGRLVRCVSLAGFRGVLNTVTQEHTAFAQEFSDRVRVIACLTELPNIAHSDAAPGTLSPAEWEALRRRMQAGAEDSLVVVWGDARDVETACREIRIRAEEATAGVPSDTRQPYKDGTNGFERVLPGAERMYPDTDLPPIVLDAARVERASAVRPEFIWETEGRFADGGMAADDVRRLSISPRAAVATRAIVELGESPVLLGVLLSQRMRAASRKGLRPERLTDDALYELLRAHALGRITAGGLPWAMTELLRRCAAEAIIDEDVLRFLDEIAMRPASDDEVEERIEAAVAAAPAGRFPGATERQRHLMGVLMRDLVGRADGRGLEQRLRTKLAERTGVFSTSP